jgi:tellurite resistance protein TehA-like permease
MSEIINFLIEPGTQAVFWLICIIFAILFARFVKKLSFGDDTGTKAWTIIAAGLLLIGLRVSFKLIIPDFESSYDAQVARYLLGMSGSIILLYGFYSYHKVINNMYRGV